MTNSLSSLASREVFPPRAGLSALLATRDSVFTLRPPRIAAPGFHAEARTAPNAARISHLSLGEHDDKHMIDRNAETPLEAGREDAGATAASASLAQDLATARADGFAAGLAEGTRRTEAAFGTRVAEIDRLLASLASARAFDPAELAPALGATVHALIAELLAVDPALETHGLETRARAALVQLADAYAPATLWLAPAQAGALGPALARPGLDIVADPTLSPGALRLTTRYSRLDDSPRDRAARPAPVLAQDIAQAASSFDSFDETDAVALPRTVTA